MMDLDFKSAYADGKYKNNITYLVMQNFSIKYLEYWPIVSVGIFPLTHVYWTSEHTFN